MGAKAVVLCALVALSIADYALGACVSIFGVPNQRFCDVTYSQSDCVEAGCTYDACGSAFRRLSSIFDTDYGGGTTYDTGFVCLEGCNPSPAAKVCESYADFECPLLAGCALAQAPIATTAPSATPTTPATTPTTSTSSPVEDTPSTDATPAGETQVVCDWVQRLGCSATVATEEGHTLLLLRLIMGACIADTAEDGSGCSTPDMLDFCFNGVFADSDGAAICVPVGTNFTSALELLDAYPVYTDCIGVVSDDCTAARRVVYEGLNCPFCTEIANVAAPAESVCSAVTTEAQCLSTPVDLAPVMLSGGDGSSDLEPKAPAEVEEPPTPPPPATDTQAPDDAASPPPSNSSPPKPEDADPAPADSAAADAMPGDSTPDPPDADVDAPPAPEDPEDDAGTPDGGAAGEQAAERNTVLDAAADEALSAAVAQVGRVVAVTVAAACAACVAVW